jgi:hypothetical protein
MGKRPTVDESFMGNMGSIQTSIQREDNPAMTTGHERIAAKAQCQANYRKDQGRLLWIVEHQVGYRCLDRLSVTVYLVILHARLQTNAVL